MELNLKYHLYRPVDSLYIIAWTLCHMSICTSTLKSIVAESDHRQNRMIFKLAVEMAVMMNVVAANNNIDPVSLERLRGECVKEVKRLNGSFSFDDAVSWQKGWEENE